MVTITIIVDGEVHGLRKWLVVPRKGDYIEVDAGNGKMMQCGIVHVVWLKHGDPDQVAVELHCNRPATYGAGFSSIAHQIEKG